MMLIQDTTPRAQLEILDRLRDREPGGSRAGETREELGVLVVSEDPRERHLFRDNYNLAFQLQEHWAYWAGANPGHVERYNPTMETWIDDATGKLPGSAYGERLRETAGHDQIARALDGLRDSPRSRRHYMAVHQPEVEDYECNDVACTVGLHPFVRDGELHMIADIRSQDMYWGYSYDAANNQWIQEAMAGALGLDVGNYWHFMHSCHYYTKHDEAVDSLLDDGEVHDTEHPANLPGDEWWAALCRGLKLAREGMVPRDELRALDERAPFYRDWLGVIASWEQANKHGAPDQGRGVAETFVDDGRWAEWALERAEN